MRGWEALIVMLAALAAGTARADAEDAGVPLEKSYSSWITLDATGRVLDADVDAGTSESVAGVVTGLARDLAFTPAQIDGVPVPSRVSVGLGVRFTPDATGAYVAALRWAKVNALVADRLGPPRYPARELRSSVGGWALASYVVGPDGRVDPATVRILDQGAFEPRRLLGGGHASAKAFADATRAAVASWTYRTAELDGAAVAVRIATPMTFRPNVQPADSRDLPDFVRAVQMPVPAAELQPGAVLPAATGLPESPPDGDADTIEITGSRVSRAIIQ